MIQQASNNAFTLIELLIVVAIIAILAAIAVPNFLEAQTRAKVARVKADLRSADTGLSTYMVDYNSYPLENKLSLAIRVEPYAHTPTLERLTTPIAYLNGVTAFTSPFKTRAFFSGAKLKSGPHDYPAGMEQYAQIYWYDARTATDAAIWGSNVKAKWWFMQSAGPDGYSYRTNDAMNGMVETPAGYTFANSIIYDSTNGTVSKGAVFRTGGAPSGPGKPFFQSVMRSY